MAIDSTSQTLLQRVRRMEPVAWNRLCTLYGPVVYGWCRRAGLQHSDAGDATQEVFRAVFQAIGQFQRDRDGTSFRGWLRAITINQVRLANRLAGRWLPTAGDAVADVPDLSFPDAGTDGDPANERHRLVHRALDLLRGEVSASTWTVFVRTVLQGEPGEQVAAALGLSTNAVRQARFRVLRRLRQELDGLL